MSRKTNIIFDIHINDKSLIQQDKWLIWHSCKMMNSLIQLLQWTLALFMMITLLEVEKKLHKDNSSSANHWKKVLSLNQFLQILMQNKYSSFV